MALGSEDVERVDRDYIPFESFDGWRAVPIDRALWDLYAGRVTAARATHRTRSAEVDEQSLRKAALHTGALEGLHPADRGVTVTIVREVAWREALEQEAGTETLRHVEAAIESFDLVLDLSPARSSRMPRSIGWVTRCTV